MDANKDKVAIKRYGFYASSNFSTHKESVDFDGHQNGPRNDVVVLLGFSYF